MIPVCIDLMQYENRSWKLDGSLDCSIPSARFVIRCNGKKLPYRTTQRCAQAVLDNLVLKDRTAFVLELSAQQLQEDNEIAFFVTDEGGTERPLQAAALSYQARVHSGLLQSYWCFGQYMVTLLRNTEKKSCGQSGDAAGQKQDGSPDDTASEQKQAGGLGDVVSEQRQAGSSDDAVSEQKQAGSSGDVVSEQKHPVGLLADGIRIRRAKRTARIRQELRFLREMLCAPYGSRQMFLMRSLYWLAYPVYSRKNIWMTFDKLYKGGDCGEYFYKYVSAHGARGIIPAYVIGRDAADRRRLEAEGYRPLVHRSRRQRLAYLYARMVFASHSGVNSFCGFNNWEIRFVQDRLRAVNTCIQHGLSVQNLEADSNRVVNNNKRYYCASPCEIENLSRPEYDYEKEALCLTGIPRYDGLVSRTQRQILITPTWRAYLAMPSVMGSARPYNPEFKQTEYFRIYQELLSDARLMEAAQKNDYRIVYLLHPVISAQKKDFDVPPCVELLSAVEADYEELLTQSALMVTDYSGVQFDFAYQRKPVVYYHPPQLPPHYTGGGFDYARQGFGEICTERDALVAQLQCYMEQGCALKEQYRARQDAFFAFDDQESCRRIYEDAAAYQKMHGKVKYCICRL